MTVANGLHSAVGTGDNHIPYQWSYANAAARTGAGGFVAGDVGKLARQTDDNSLWILTATMPTWVAVGTSVGQVSTLNFIIDGGGSAITTGVKGDLVVDFAGTIVGVTTLADQTGSIVVDIWKDTYANFPPTVADSICAAAKPTLSSAAKAQDTTLTGWTTSIAAGDILRFNVDSATTVTRVTVALKIQRT